MVPSASLEYSACFDGYECARLRVPLDWNATQVASGESVAIAIIRRPALVPITDQKYGGAILLNPGILSLNPLLYITDPSQEDREDLE